VDSLTGRFQKEVFLPYLEMLKAEYRFHHPTFDHAKKMWEEKLTEQELINGPYLEKSQIYEAGEPLEALGLNEATIATINKRLGGRSLWKHQTDALKLLLNGENAVIATGTSSGKTLCYQVPILDDLIRDPSPGLRAIIIYPLNALVNDQLDEWERMLKDHSHITFARFTGQTPASQEDYEERLRDVIIEKSSDKGGFTQQELQREADRQLKQELRNDIPNKLNHREAIRDNPPHVLITNFSMLEYLLERPIDASIFRNSHLKFIVLDEAHAYRGVQATEIAFLIRRLKDRLGQDKITCIATSATLGKKGDKQSTEKVRKFVSHLFNEEFNELNPIYGTPAEPQLEKPSFCPIPGQYLKAIEILRKDKDAEIGQYLGARIPATNNAEILLHDENLYRLRKEILNKPKRLIDAANELWQNDPQAHEGLQALLEIVATAKSDETHEDLLPTRLHYFVRAQDGLHVCLHKQCPGRRDGKPAFFVSRKNNDETPEGSCPDCDSIGQISKLIEVVTCRKCGYLYGALQDLGPRRAQNPDSGNDETKPYFDSFSTELGWAADSFWSYFSVEDDLPYPNQPKTEEDDDDQDDLFINPAKLEWCVICGKKSDKGAGDNCACDNPHLREIKIFHRQCPHSGKSKNNDNLYKQVKKALTSCLNCGAKNGSGLEPVRRFQESDDETGLAMAIPLAHFNVSNLRGNNKAYRKLLCFTDHRQRAAAFPSLLEEETFVHDMGRKIVEIVNESKEPFDLVALGIKLSEIADTHSGEYDPDFFLPVSRLPDDLPTDSRQKRNIFTNLWIGETISYFGIPDSARESAEDLGLVSVRFQVTKEQTNQFNSILSKFNLSPGDSDSLLQVLLGFIRQSKAFTLPNGVSADDPAFGRVTPDISYILKAERGKGIANTKRWLPCLNKDGSFKDNMITDYLRRVLQLPSGEVLSVAENIWDFITSQDILIGKQNRWKIDHERIFILKALSRFICKRCSIVATYSSRHVCPRKECDGRLEGQSFNASKENIIARWVAGKGLPQFTGLKSEEHTAQINKELARIIENEFRAEGINLLSSTTTFEMGINIGDLSKILLRNAPPNSASYVQRVGRAGRGKDKNSVCVTLCRRTKYDADAWNDPPRLMSGEVRTPTVFIQNKVIAQRHFNAIVFAQFLRIKIAQERALGTVKQSIRLESFLPLASRVNIPDNWFQIRPTELFLDFLAWLKHQNETDVFQTEAGRSLLEAITNFENGKAEASKMYKDVIDKIAEELLELMAERQTLYRQGFLTVDVEQSIKNLLGGDIIAVLAKRGFLPRYAFPLDVVTLETKTNRWSKEEDVELSRDRGIAISEFAPGAQVIAHKKIFTSAGLYVVSKTDKPARQWYSKCPSCEQIRTALTQDALTGSCNVCNRSITSQYIFPFIEPKAFSILVDKKTQGTARHRRSMLIRQRQVLTHFIDSVDDSNFTDFKLFRIALKENGNLFRYNKGPGNNGFMLCPTCGFSEPLRSYKAGKKHKKLRAFSKEVNCNNEQPWTKPIAYGHQFQSFCLIIRPAKIPPSVESLAFALQKGLCMLLDIETSDIGVSWRWLANKSDRAGTEIILYDQTQGGAGFVREGFDNWKQVVEKAYEVCNTCKCERACYDCLKNYRNQSYHEDLDRMSVINFI
jgi:ATP-dependent helicase YprA (DUF1998 family)